ERSSRNSLSDFRSGSALANGAASKAFKAVRRCISAHLSRAEAKTTLLAAEQHAEKRRRSDGLLRLLLHFTSEKNQYGMVNAKKPYVFCAPKGFQKRLLFVAKLSPSLIMRQTLSSPAEAASLSSG